MVKRLGGVRDRAAFRGLFRAAAVHPGKSAAHSAAKGAGGVGSSRRRPVGPLFGGSVLSGRAAAGADGGGGDPRYAREEREWLDGGGADLRGGWAAGAGCGTC